MSSEDAKRLKKEEEEDDDENDNKPITSLQNKNKKSLSLKDVKLKKEASSSKIKKEEQFSDEDFTLKKKTPSNVKPKKEVATASAEKKKAPSSEVKKEKTGTSDKKKGGKISEQNGKKQEEKKRGGKVEDSTVKKETKQKKVYDLPGQKRDPPEERDPLRIFYESLYKQIPNSEMAAIWLGYWTIRVNGVELPPRRPRPGSPRVRREHCPGAAIQASSDPMGSAAGASLFLTFSTSCRMMESGLLAKDVAKKLFETKRKKAQQQKLGSPMKTVVTVKKQSASSISITKKTSVSTEKKKTPPTKAPSAQPKKRKIVDESSDDDDDDDFVLSRKIKKPKVA